MGGGGCSRARLGPTERGYLEPCLSRKGVDQRTSPAGSLPVLAPPCPISRPPHPPPLPVHRPPRLLVGRSIRSLSGSGQQLPWLDAELEGESPGMMCNGWGKAFYWPSLCTLPPSSSRTIKIEILFTPPPVTSGDDRVIISPVPIFRGWGRSPFSSPLGIKGFNLSRSLVLSEGDTLEETIQTRRYRLGV